MRKTLLIVVAVALAAYAVGSCNGGSVERDSALEANAYRLAREARPKREALVKAKQETDRARTALGRAQELVSVREQQLSARLDGNDSLLARRTVTVAELQDALRESTAAGRLLLAANAELRDSLTAFQSATLVERVAGDTVVAHIDKATVAFKDLAESRKCDVLGVACPSRKTSFLLGGAVGVVAVLLIL